MGGGVGTCIKEPLKESKLLTGLPGGRARWEDVCELEVSMVYIVSSRAARATSENLHEEKSPSSSSKVCLGCSIDKNLLT